MFSSQTVPYVPHVHSDAPSPCSAGLYWVNVGGGWICLHALLQLFLKVRSTSETPAHTVWNIVIHDRAAFFSGFELQAIRRVQFTFESVININLVRQQQDQPLSPLQIVYRVKLFWDKATWITTIGVRIVKKWINLQWSKDNGSKCMKVCFIVTENGCLLMLEQVCIVSFWGFLFCLFTYRVFECYGKKF